MIENGIQTRTTMTTYQKVLKLMLSHEEAAQYIPPPGFEISWSEWDHQNNTVVARFTVSDNNSVFYQERKTKNDIEQEIENRFRGLVLFDYSNTDSQLNKIACLQKKELKRSDILMDDAVMAQMPKGTKHRMVDEHFEVKSKQQIDEANQLLQDKLGTTQKLYGSERKPWLFRVGSLEQT